MNTYDFHAISFFIPLALAAFYFFEEERWALSALFFALAAGTKEDAALLTVSIGAFALIRAYREKNGAKKRFAAGLLAVSALYFIAVSQFIMPAFGGGIVRLDRYSQLGDSLSGIATHLIGDPKLFFSTIFQAPKLMYIFWLLAPVAFLPLLSWSSIFLVVPGILENTLTNFPQQFSSLMQYDAIIIPGLFLGAIYGLAFVTKRSPAIRSAAWKVLLSAVFIAFLMRSPVSPFAFPTQLFQSNAYWDSLRALAAEVPPGVSVSAITALVPHLSQREHIYMLGTEYDHPVDYFIIDSADPSGFGTLENLQNYVNQYLDSGNFTYEIFRDRFIILRRKGF